MIEVRNLTKKYGSNVAVNDVSFSVDRGEIVGLLGPNGGGEDVYTQYDKLGTYLHLRLHIGQWVRYTRADPMTSSAISAICPSCRLLYPDLTVREYLEFVFDLKRCTFDRAPTW